MTQHKQSHRIKRHDHHIKWHDMTCHVATNHSSSPHVTSQPITVLHLTPQATSWHQNRSHHHHGTAEGSFTAKKWFGHRAGRSPCAHSIGKFFLCYIVPFFFWNFRPRLARELLVSTDQLWIISVHVSIFIYSCHFCIPVASYLFLSFISSTASTSACFTWPAFFCTCVSPTNSSLLQSFVMLPAVSSLAAVQCWGLVRVPAPPGAVVVPRLGQGVAWPV